MPNRAYPMNAVSGSPLYDAAEVRRFLQVVMGYGGRAMGARQGIRPGGTTNIVTLSGLAITVQPHVGLIDPARTTVQGSYWYAIETPLTPTGGSPAGSVAPANGTYARKDIVVGHIYDDQEDTSGQATLIPEYVQGTASASPVTPAVPTGAMQLAVIDVPVSGGGSPVATTTAPFAVASGGVIPVRSVAERDALTAFAYTGMVCDRRDRGWLERFDGTAWRVVGTATVTNFADLGTLITNPFNGQLAVVSSTSTMYEYVTGTGWYEVASPRTPRGVVARGLKTTSSTATALPDYQVMRVSSIPIKAGRLYGIWTSALPMDSTVSTDIILSRLRYTTNATDATTASAILPGTLVQMRQVDVNNAEHSAIQTVFSSATDITLSVLLCVGRLAGSGNCALILSAGGDAIQLVIEDIGQDPGNTGVSLA